MRAFRALRLLVRGAIHLLGWVGFSGLLLFLLMNATIGPYRFLRGRASEVVKNKGARGLPAADESSPSDVRLLQVYPGKSLAQIEDIRLDIRESRPGDPTVADHPPFSSRHVNLSAAGYRLSRHDSPFAREAGRRNVFLFGGSTAWGYQLPDDETIASHLQRCLEESAGGASYHVYNYGVVASYSKYERMLLERLILQGRVPDVVVFLDGLNEFCRLPLNRPRERGTEPAHVSPLLFKTVIAPLLFWEEEFGLVPRRVKEAVVPYDERDIERAAREMTDNWRLVKGICREYGIECLLVLQPVPVYDYPLEEHLFLTAADLQGGKSYFLAAQKGYRHLVESDRLQAVDHLDLHQLRVDGPDYLDACHYTSAFGDAIAGAMAEAILKAEGAVSGKHLAAGPERSPAATAALQR